MNAKVLINPRGHEVPVETISPLELLKDEMVRELIKKAHALQAHTQAVKQAMTEHVASYLGLAAQEYGIELTGDKGNVTLHSYDGSKKVVINVNERIFFNSEQLAVARQLFLKCFREWTKDGRGELKAMIENAFNTDKQGRVNQYQLMRILRIESNDKTFQKAQKALRDALNPLDCKSYIRFYERDDKGNWESINLNFSGL
jgi:hypothetical protein